MKFNINDIKILSLRVEPSERSEINFQVKKGGIQLRGNTLIIKVDGDTPVNFGDENKQNEEGDNGKV